ncbi:MAG: hypothetical protein FWD82_09360 [Defluviitaleaceae bacterium]|nr:hypothetical protein [Defluviitaleaceae bacterium]
MTRKKAVIIGWTILILSIIAAFISTARSALFGDALFSDIDFLSFIISAVPTIFIYFIITHYILKNKDAK